MDLKYPGTNHICIGAFFFPQTRRTFYLFKPLWCQMWRGIERNANVQLESTINCDRVIKTEGWPMMLPFISMGRFCWRVGIPRDKGYLPRFCALSYQKTKQGPYLFASLRDQDTRPCVYKHMFRNCPAQVFFAWHVQVYQLILNLNCNDEVLPDIRITRF